jgi:hypothetical protein
MVLRYLAAFGPASVADFSAWSGLTRLDGAIERLRPRLRSFRDERGRELLDVPDGVLPDAGVSAPPRFLGDYDNVALGHRDRSRIVSEDVRKRAAYNPFESAFLVDGYVRGTWRLKRDKKAATLTVRPLTPLTAQERSELSDEAERLFAFLADNAPSSDIRFVDEA